MFLLLHIFLCNFFCVAKKSHPCLPAVREVISHSGRTLRCELAVGPDFQSGQSIGVRCGFVSSVATATARIFRESFKTPKTLALTKNNAGDHFLSPALLFFLECK
jgi:hypothetical protein